MIYTELGQLAWLKLLELMTTMHTKHKKVQSSIHMYLLICLQATTDDMEVPDLPVNYVMDEFVKAKEKANLPKKGTVKDAASGWYKAHHD